MLRGLVTAVRTLTILPIPGRDAERLTASLPWFPFVGALLGGAVYGLGLLVGLAAGGSWPTGSAVVMVAAGAWLTRGLHLDGLADCADAFSNLGVLALSEDDVNGALDFFKRALEIEPTHRDALPNYLTTTFALGAFEEAYSLLQCYVDSSPDNPDLICQLAYCHLKLG